MSKLVNMFTCLDAPRAFDRVRHYILFHELIDRVVPVHFV